MRRTLGGISLVDVSIMRLREHLTPAGYYVAFSGGADSQAVEKLCVQGDIPHDSHYHDGGTDPPELKQFIKREYPDVIIERPDPPFWKQVPERGLPTRKGRWCCEVIKEWGGRDRMVVTGVRSQESRNRKKWRLVQACEKQNKILFNPILDWTRDEVWEYLGDDPHCELYDEGFTRLGCVMCPMATQKNRLREMERWPKIANAWKIAAYKRWEKQTVGLQKFPTPESYWQWWISDQGVDKFLEGGKNEGMFNGW